MVVLPNHVVAAFLNASAASIQTKMFELGMSTVRYSPDERDRNLFVNMIGACRIWYNSEQLVELARAGQQAYDEGFRRSGGTISP